MQNQSIPDWYFDKIDLSTLTKGHRRGVSFAGRTLRSFAEAIAADISAPGCRDSWLGAVEPRTKLLAVIILIVTTTLLHSISALLLVLLIALAVAFSVSVPSNRLASLWLGVPVFSLAIVLPAITNLVTPGQEVLKLWTNPEPWVFGPLSLPAAIYITQEGLLVACRFVLRTLNCITLAYLLVCSTRPEVIVSSLRDLGMPKIFGMVLTMSQRYIQVIMRAAQEMHTAKISRTISSGSPKQERRWASTGIAQLFRRTYLLADQVHLAMISRGFTGEPRIMRKERFNFISILILICVLMLSAGLVFAERAGMDVLNWLP